MNELEKRIEAIEKKALERLRDPHRGLSLRDYIEK